jgi:hypothetical protein
MHTEEEFFKIQPTMNTKVVKKEIATYNLPMPQDYKCL